MQLSVIILNYNVSYFLELCLLSVQKALQNLDAEIIVVDNNSSDNSCEMVKNKFPTVTLIENKTNFGFPKGNNLGFEKASGEYVCILNPDTIVAEDCFDKILKFAQSKTNLGIVGCRLIDGSGVFLPESKRGIPTPWVAFTKIVGLYKLFPKLRFFNQYYAQQLPQNQTGQVSVLVGAFMVMERKLYAELAGFDENCFMYSDDIDLSYRALQLLKKNYYFSDTTAIHFKGESTVKDDLYMKRFQEAMQYFYKKHFRVSRFFSVFMKIGILFFSFIKKFQGKQQSKLKPENVVLLSASESLQNQISKKIKINLTLSSLEKLTAAPKTEIIFDCNCLSFKLMIEFMKNNQKQKYSYKFAVSDSRFLLGSQSNADRGEVVLF